MNIINVITKAQLDALYNEGALTWEGLDSSEENLNSVVEWLKDHKALPDGIEPTFHIIKGKLMNGVYGLTGDNAYHDDLNIVSVTGIIDYQVALARFEVDGRWFSDIVDNNARRQGEAYVNGF